MGKLENPFLLIAKRLNQEELVSWLEKYLRDESVEPDISVPPDYTDKATFILSWLGAEENIEVAKCFGDAALSVLSRLSAKLISISDDMAGLLMSNLLSILEAVPTSASDKTARLLNILRLNERYKGYPSNQVDCHRLILFALANHLRADAAALKGWEQDFVREMENPSYVVAAFSVLAQLSPTVAISQLPKALELIKRADIPATGLVFGLSCVLNSDIQLWEKLAQQLQTVTECEGVANEFAETLQDLGLQEVANTFLQEMNKKAGAALVLHTSYAMESLKPVLQQLNELRAPLGKDIPYEVNVLRQKALWGALWNTLPDILTEIAKLNQTQALNWFMAIFSLRNGNISDIGIRIGNALASLIGQKSIDAVELKKLWSAAVYASHSFKEPECRSVPLHILKGWVRYCCLSEWRASDDTIIDILNQFRDVLRAGAKVADAWRKRRRTLPNIIVGCGPFHEDILLAGIVRSILHKRFDVPVRIQDTEWGGYARETPVDVFVCNEHAVGTTDQLPDCAPIFGFCGYHIFAHRQWLIQCARQRELPNRVVAVCENLLSMPSVEMEPSANEEDMRKRAIEAARLAVHSGLSYKADTDFQKIWQVLVQVSNVELSQVQRGTPITDYDIELEEFVKGNRNVFMGGAVHARILVQWWSEMFEPKDAPVVRILGPRELRVLIPKSLRWPMLNRLFFSGKLGNDISRGGKRTLLVTTLTDLYRKVASAIGLLLEKPDGDEDTSKFLRYALCALTKNESNDSNKRRWSFLTHEEELKKVLTEDDQFGNRHAKQARGSKKSASK